ncbi:copper resistance CopC family protein [Micromonospora sp. WMMD1082]|uniref:copper resistance CopC family protein n=1 Tax=Micromonospora sp. WMMD1082 TaxID=3016104 RepID=UPI0024179F13|nr:copper resistance CopC family protein [Micromonospora sp. WMMD1082]MDG4796359.1 copper resistance protein CopC [Micromonospora sp. WMMD1082]
MRAWAVLFGVAFGVSLLMPATPAAAHNQLTGSSPRDGARVATAPERVELRFLARLDASTTKITITGPDNVDALGGKPRFSGNRVSAPLAPARAGLYIVGYEVVSGDGHPITGEVRFTLTTGTPAETPEPTPADPTAATPAPTTAPAEATPTPAPTTPVGATPVPRSDESSGGGWWWAAVAAVPLLAILAVARLIRRRAARR